ncbi:hypothetical protein [Paraburkholderia susongensis]|uniref:Cell wall surface anchor family protein n=1 Tax=Paraburkholderia susongensis TaxID=1515439 RepID=A0A1X7LYR6_9BURK|nr:hypothetical protein [Paraburkholderia susongensis]SMG58674.1 hypothetical protein SAMN06265784_111168 [Paraburkholderia susongensis]
MADSVASSQSRPRRAASKKQRQGSVSTETENKLARAARSAQRLAQLSGASRDGSTLDLFPDDPTRAALEAMNIDIRQGTLDGFELPDVVLQAVGALDDNALPDKAARRAPRAAKADAAAPVNAQLSGLDIEPPPAAEIASADGVADGGAVDVAGSVNAATNPSGASSDATPKADATTGDKPTATAREQSAPLTSAMAAATVARSVTALRQTTDAGSATGSMVAGSSVAPTSGGGKRPQRFTATFAKAAMASGETAATTGAVIADAGNASQSADEAAVQTSARSAGLAAATEWVDMEQVETERADTKQDKSSAPAAAPVATDTDTHAAFAAPWREAHSAEATTAALRAGPELDLARATAFADTVDALYGVIADQRRAATDHSRRVKWMLSVVVGALLVTVAIGVTQTLLLMRLTRETTAQQHRIEQMMQNQQAAMVSLLDTHAAMAAANAASAPATATPVATTPAAPQQAAGVTPVHTRHAGRAPHGHRTKASPATN